MKHVSVVRAAMLLGAMGIWRRIQPRITPEKDAMRNALLVALALVGTILAVLSVAASRDSNGKIAFESRDSQIFVMNADGTSQAQLIFENGSHPKWSPNGRKIVFYSDRDGDEEIFVMNADGTNQTQLTDNSVSDIQPSWSPDGRRIVFVSDRGVDGGGIFVMDADGGNQELLASAEVRHPAWSPNGRKIAFGVRRGIFVMDADGTNQTKLTDDFTNERSAAWSPDGRKIVFVSKLDGDLEVFVIDADGSNKTQLTFNLARETHAAWSPNGKKIVFQRHLEETIEIFVMDADGTNQTQRERPGARGRAVRVPHHGALPVPAVSEGGVTTKQNPDRRDYGFLK